MLISYIAIKPPAGQCVADIRGTDVKGGGDEVSNMIRTEKEVLEENEVVGQEAVIEEECF